MVQGDRVDPGVHAATGQQCRQRRREPDPVAVLGQVQGLDAEPVPAQQHAAAVAFDDGEREHAVQVGDEVVAPVVVGLEQHLGVAVREEPVAVPGQFAPQLLVVVDAAVPGNRQAQFGVDHRLGAGFGQVDDLEATMTKCYPALRPDPRRVRTPPCQHVSHR